MPVYHQLTATTPDNPSYEIRPTHWNSEHAVSITHASEISGAFSNDAGYNVSFTTIAGNKIVASANVTAAPSPVNVTGANGSSVNAQTIAFSNSNNVTLGVSTAANGATITGSIPAQTAFVLSNSNGISFGTNGSTVTATVATNYMASANSSLFAATGFTTTTAAGSVVAGTHDTAGLRLAVPAYLTTARASNDAIGLNSALTANGVSVTANSSGLSLNFPAFLTTARASNDAIGLNTAGSNVTWTANSAGLSLDARGYAGTATTFNGTNASASITLDSAGLRLDLSAAAGGGGGVTPVVSANNGSYSFTTLSLSNANGISFGTSAGSAITASHNGITTGRASNDGIGLNTAQSNVTWTVNSSGLSLDARGYAGTGTSATNASVTLNSNGLAISVAAPGGAASQTLYATGNTTVNSSGTMALSSLLMRGYGIVSLGTSNGSILVSSPDPVTATDMSVGISGGNTAGDTGTVANGRVVFAGGANITLSGSTNASSMTISIVGGAGGGVTPVVSANNGSYSFTTLSFSNANGVSFGTSAGSAVTASYTVPSVTQYFSNTATTFNGANISGSMTLNTNGLQLSMSVAAPGAAAENNAINLLGANTAGNTTATGSTIGWSGVNVTLSGTNNSQVVISAPATSSLSATGQLSISTNGSTISIGVGHTVSGLVLAPFGGLGGPIPFAQSSISLGQNSLYLYPFQIEDYLSCDHFRMPVLVTNSSSAAASVQKGITYQVGVYTRHSTNGTLYSRHYSSSYTIAASHNSNVSWMQSMITAIGNSTSYNTLTASSAGINLSASLHGPREFIIPVSSVFAPGEYFIGIVQSSSSVGAGGAVLNVSNMAVAYQTYNRVGVSTAGSLTGFFQFMGAGTYSATTGALPASINATQINQLGTLPMLFAATGTV